MYHQAIHKLQPHHQSLGPFHNKTKQNKTKELWIPVLLPVTRRAIIIQVLEILLRRYIQNHTYYILMLYNHRHTKDIHVDSLVNDEHSFRALMKKQTLVF